MKIEKNRKISLVVGGIMVALVAFYAGMTYGGNNVRASIMNKSQNFGQNGALGARGGRAGAGGGFTIGSILSKDATSITVSLMSGGPASPSQGGSKIIFLDSNTKVSKQTTGTLDDLSVGTQVSITGTPNTDGSINATAVHSGIIRGSAGHGRVCVIAGRDNLKSA